MFDALKLFLRPIDRDDYASGMPRGDPVAAAQRSAERIDDCNPYKAARKMYRYLHKSVIALQPPG